MNHSQTLCSNVNLRLYAMALVRGAQVEMAAALMQSLPALAGSGDAALALLAEKAVAIGEWDLAREAAGGITDVKEKAWRLQLVCARYVGRAKVGQCRLSVCRRLTLG